MEFLARRKKNPPSVIIVALIDVLIVVLIFLLVTTTFKQQPALKLTLPESSQAESQSGSSELSAVKITIDRKGQFYLGSNDQPITAEQLESELKNAVRTNPQLRIEVAPDTEAPVGSFVKAMDATKAAGVSSSVTVMTKATKTD
jgi:biopolymer transport protein ExbD